MSDRRASTTPRATATINAATVIDTEPAPFTASFSSRGPLRATGDLLKPDLIAPGQDILAAVAPPGNSGRLFDLYSGTSMSSPHVAGLAALLKDLHPDWTPMMIKSALMTTAYDVLDGPNTNPLVIFRQGAGHVKPNSAADPGLVFNSGWNDWLAFICATQPQGLDATCNALWGRGYSKDASDLNTASIAIGDLAGVQPVTRTVNNIGAQAESYTASYTGLGGITVSLPGAFTVAKGVTQSLQEKKSEGQAPIIFGMAVLFVFLLLAAQYESWSLPFSVLLATPTVVLGTFLGMWARQFDLNVYAQIGLVMLIGLAAKNAILIVEFAKMKRDAGTDAVAAAIEAAKMRLRPIIMTSFAFILGVVPLILAQGAGAGSRVAMGVTVFSGMVAATLLAIFFVPVLYVTVERGVARLRGRPAPLATAVAPVEGGK